MEDRKCLGLKLTKRANTKSARAGHPKKPAGRRANLAILEGGQNRESLARSMLPPFSKHPSRSRVGSRKTKMSTFEASFRQLAKRAVDGHLPAIRKFLKTCEQYGVIAPQPPEVGGGVVVAPEGVAVKDWIDGVTELAPADEDRATSNRNASP